MTFPEFLRAEVIRLGRGTSQHGEQLAAIVCGTTDRTIRRWMAGETTPSKAEQAGAQLLLARAKPLGPRSYPKAAKAPQ